MECNIATVKVSGFWPGVLFTLRRHWPVVLPVILAASVFHAWFGPGLLIGDDQFRFSPDVLASYLPWRDAWEGSFAFGLSSATVSPAYPLWSLIGALTKLGLTFATIERLVWYWPFFVCAVAAPYAFAYHLTRSPWAASIASAVYVINTWTIGLVQRGHIGSLVAYSLMPLAMLAWTTLLRRRLALDAVFFGALLTLQIMYDLRYAYVTLVPCGIWFAFYVGREVLAHRGPSLWVLPRTLAWTGVSLFAFNSYWLLPQVIAPAHLPAGYDTLAYYISDSSYESISHALALFYPFYHHMQGTDPFGVSPVERAFWVLPILVGAALPLSWRKGWAIPLAIAAMIGIVIASGPRSPFGSFNEYVFLHLPGMKLFRDISKFMSLIAFAYAFLLALGFERAAASARLLFGKRIGVAAPTLACLCIIGYGMLMRDAYNPLRFSNFSSTRLSQADVDVQRFLNKQPGFFRTLVFPTLRPELVATNAHPIVPADYLVESAPQDGGLSDLFPTWLALLHRYESPILPAILAEGAVRYLIVVDDHNGELYRPFAFDTQYAESIEFFRGRPWLREVAKFGGYVIFALNPPVAPRAFFAPEPITAIGSPENLVALAGTPAWPALPAAIIANDLPTGGAHGWMLASDPTTSTDGVSGSFSTTGSARVTAWVGGEQSSLPSALELSRMVDVSELRPTTVPAYPFLPTPPVAVEIADTRIISAPYDDAPQNSEWLGVTGPLADIELINWSGLPLHANIKLTMKAANPMIRTVVATIGQAGESSAIEMGGCQRTYCPFTLWGAHLEPGLNVLHLRAEATSLGQIGDANYSFLFADRLLVWQSGAAHRPSIPKPLHARVQASNDGLNILLQGCCRALDYSGSAFVLFRPTEIPLTWRPKITIRYQPPSQTIRMALFLELRRRSGGQHVNFVHSIPSSATVDSADIFKGVQLALDDAWDDAGQEQDYRSISDHSGLRPEASDYDLVATRLVLAGHMLSGRSTTARLIDARMDVSGSSKWNAVLQYVDLRTAIIKVISNSLPVHPIVERKRFFLRVPKQNQPRNEEYSFGIPTIDDGSAKQAIFWMVVPEGSSLGMNLTFTSLDRPASSITVLAAGRPTLTDPDLPLPPAWQLNTLHVANGRTGHWRRFLIDLEEVKTFRLPHRGIGYRLSQIQIDLQEGGSASEQGEEVELSDLALAHPSGDQALSVEHGAQMVVIDGNPMPLKSLRQVRMSDILSGSTGSFNLPAGNHTISVEPTLPIKATSIFVAPPSLPTTVASETLHFAQLSPSEYVCEVRGAGGLLVFPMSYAPGWRLFSGLPSMPKLSGLALIDAWRFRSLSVSARHVVVNGVFNGWYLPAGDAEVVLFYAPETTSELCALVWIVLSLFIIVASVRWTRAGQPRRLDSRSRP